MRMSAIAVASALAMFNAGPAAAGIPYGYDEFTDPVLALPAGAFETFGEQVYLCHLVRKFHLAYVPVLYWSEAYVLGEQACTTERYRTVTTERLASLKATGVLPADLPAAPLLSWAQCSPVIIEALLVAAIVLSIRGAAKRQQARFAEMGTLSETTKRVLDTLCHAARASGLTDAGGIDFIAQLTTKVTGENVSPALVSRAMATSLPKPKPVDFSRLVKGLKGAQRDTLMHAVLIVAASGKMPKASQGFIKSLATASRMDQKRLSGLMTKVATA